MLGSLLWWMARKIGALYVLGAELADADEEGVALKEEGEAEDGVGPGGVFGGGGMADVREAFRDGDAAAEDEDEQGDDERPEVELFAVAERMSFVGGLAALALAGEKRSRAPLPQSTTEWMASDSMAEEPVKRKPMILATAMPMLAAMATKMDLREEG